MTKLNLQVAKVGKNLMIETFLFSLSFNRSIVFAL